MDMVAGSPQPKLIRPRSLRRTRSPDGKPERTEKRVNGVNGLNMSPETEAHETERTAETNSITRRTEHRSTEETVDAGGDYRSDQKYAQENPGPGDYASTHKQPDNNDISPNQNMIRGFIYILTSAAMPGVLNIGSTGRHPEDRAKELSNEFSDENGTATFDVAYYAWSEDAAHDAAHIHSYLFDYRNSDTNFFTMPSQQAIEAIESQLKIKRMFRADENNSSQNASSENASSNPLSESQMSATNGPPPAIVEGNRPVAASESVAAEQSAPVQTNTVKSISELDEKQRVIDQAKALDIELENEDQRRLEQRKIDEAVAFELHQERNRQRALRLHEDHQRRVNEEAEAAEKHAREQADARRDAIELEKKKRESEQEKLEEQARLEEFKLRQQAQTKRLRVEKKVRRRHHIASTIRIIAIIFLVAALLGWFWGTHNSSGTGGF